MKKVIGAIATIVITGVMLVNCIFNIEIDESIRCIGQMICEDIPIYSYINNIETDSYNSGEIISAIYPINRYFEQNSSKTYIADLAESELTGEDLGNNDRKNTGEKESDNTDNQIKNDNTDTSKINANGQGDTLDNIGQEVISNNIITGTVYPKADLINYDFTYSTFYTVTSITSLNKNILRPQEFLEKNMAVAHDNSQPQILIFHTHSQEEFVDSIPGDPNTSIVGVGNYLAEILQKKYGLNVIHDTSIYDYVDGKLDRSKAYTYATNGIEKILEENPSIDVVIDLHRDGVAETTHLVTEINGKQTAKIMFFNGLSYSNVNGDIGYLYNPYRDDNLAMSLQMQLLGNAYYPGFLRRIYINAYRYCLHTRGKSMLIEAGAQTNTFQEVKNAMEPLADMLNKLLSGQKVYG